MKLYFLLFVTAVIGLGVYVISSRFLQRKKRKRVKFLPHILAGGVVIILLALISFGLYATANQPDTQCKSTPISLLAPPLVDTPNGHLKQGDFYYEQGDCIRAITEYTKTIQLYPDFPQAYNNRAYTNMRLRNYKDALVDLDKAIQLNPNYVNALMNRGDIHNYYYQIDRQAAVADYRRVIALTNSSTRQQTSVCGHLLLAEHNGWNLGTFLELPFNVLSCK